MTSNVSDSWIVQFFFRPRKWWLPRFVWPWYSSDGQQRALLQVIRSAIELRWNLAEMLAAYAHDETGAQQRRIQRLAHLIQEGNSLADAVDQVPQALSDRARLAIRVGSQSGILLPLLKEAADEPQLPPDSRIRIRQGAVYLVMIACFAIPVLIFHAVKILPAWRVLMMDFGERFTGLEWQEHVFRLFSRYWALVFLIIAMVVWYFSSGRMHRLFSRGWLAPLFGRPLRLRSAELLRYLSVVKQAGRPLPAAISTMARYHYDPAFRPRLLYVRNELEQGNDSWSGMQSVGMLTSSEAQLLVTADRAGNTPWALRQVAGQKEAAALRRQAVAVEMSRIGMVLVLGALVLCFAWGTWSALAGLVQAQA
jgi:general secretion pathway protein F